MGSLPTTMDIAEQQLENPYPQVAYLELFAQQLPIPPFPESMHQRQAPVSLPLDPVETPRFGLHPDTMQGQLSEMVPSASVAMDYMPSVHSTSLMGVPAPTSSLAIALDTPEMTSDRRSSHSPLSNPPDASSPAYPLEPPPARDSPPKPLLDAPPPEPAIHEIVVLEEMLAAIALTLKSVREETMHGRGAEAGVKLGLMKTNMLKMVDSLNDIHPDSPDAAPGRPSPGSSPKSDPGGGYSAEGSLRLKPDPDIHSKRKRCASEVMGGIADERMVKLKTEDSDDVSLAAPADLSFDDLSPPALEHNMSPHSSNSPGMFPTLGTLASPHTLDFPQDTYMQSAVYIPSIIPIPSQPITPPLPILEESYPSYVPSNESLLPEPHDQVSKDQLRFAPLPVLNEASLAYPSGSSKGATWSNGCVPVPRRHDQIAQEILNPTDADSMRALAPSGYTVPSSMLPAPVYSPPASGPIGRMSRSGTVSGINPYPPFQPGYPTPSMPRSDPMMSEYDQYRPASPLPSRSGTPDEDPENCGLTDRHTGNPGNEIPPEFRQDVDRIFFDFLNMVCSDDTIRDSKGEEVHQKLMAKKMERMKESREFRPFKFRIQAFTSMFVDELAKAGYPEDKIPTKKVRSYLWASPYIMRYTAEGKKAKSKGNHVWNLEGRHLDGNEWEFKPWVRKISPTQVVSAFVGMEWSYTGRVWDPQGNRSHTPVVWSSSNMPTWLSWKDNVLSGIVPFDAVDVDIVIEARYMQQDREERLSRTLPVQVAHVSTSYSRRPSINGDNRRTASDSVLPQSMSSRPPPVPLPPSSLSQPAMVPTNENQQILQVLEMVSSSLASAVTTQSEVTPLASVETPESTVLHALETQASIMEHTAAAFGQQLSGSQLTLGTSDRGNSDMALAGKGVVLQAAMSVAAENAAAQVAVGGEPAAAVTMDAVSMVTQSAIAQAVQMLGGTDTHEVQVLIRARKIIEHKEPDLGVLPNLSSEFLPFPLGEIPHAHSTGSVHLAKQPHPSPPPPAIPFPPSYRMIGE